MTSSFPTGMQRAQSLLILAVFLAFLANALGLFSIRPGGSAALHPQLLDELLAGRLPVPLRRLDLLAFVAVGGGLALLLPRLSPINASLLTLAAMVPPFYIAWALPSPAPAIPLEYTLLTILMLFSVNVLMSYFIETHTRQRIVSAFGQYVPPALVNQISRRPDHFTMAGEARAMSVLFCDIRGFSAIAESMEPRDLAALLNHYLTVMTDVLHRHEATIDKYIGDAVMAFWGAPVAQPDHARRAVTAALDMQRAMHALRTDCQHRGWPAIEVGIGINSGVMSVGNMGSRYRVAYTVLGDAVNLAARLEQLTRLYDTEILISGATRSACPEIPCREIDHVRVRGKGRATRIFEPLADYDSAAAFAERHQAALDAYYAGAWKDADARFAELEASAPRAGYYTVMRARMREQQRPANWSGVVSFGGAFGYSLDASAVSNS